MKAGERFRFERLRLEQPIAQTFQIPPFAKNAKNGAPLCIGNAGEIKSPGHLPCGCVERPTVVRPTILPRDPVAHSGMMQWFPRRKEHRGESSLTGGANPDGSAQSADCVRARSSAC